MRVLYPPFILMGFIFLWETAFTQTSFHSPEHLSTLDGLSNDITTDILEDANGFLWISTFNGLNRYDGSEFKKFYWNQDSEISRDNLMYGISRLDDKRLVIASDGGLLILNTLTNEKSKITFDHLRKVLNNPSEYQYLNQITGIQKDNYGNFWAITPVSIYRLDTALNMKKVFWARYSQSEIAARRLEFVKKVFILKDQVVIFWLDKGIFVWHPEYNQSPEELVPVEKWENGKFKFLNDYDNWFVFPTKGGNLVLLNFEDRSLSLVNTTTGKTVSCDFPFQNGDIAYSQSIDALNDSLYALHFDTFGFGLINIREDGDNLSIHYEGKKHFPQNNFNQIILDHEKNIFATTNIDGLIKISVQKQWFDEIKIPEIHSIDNRIYQITDILPKGEKLYLSANGGGLYEYNPKRGKIIPLPLPPGGWKRNNYIWNIRSGKKDTLWLGTESGLFWYEVSSNKLGYPSAVYPSVIKNAGITTQFTDTYGLVWMGLGKGNGVAVLNSEKNECIHYSNSVNGYPYRYPIGIAEDSESNLWFVNDNSTDLVKWDRLDNSFSVVPIKINHAVVWKSIYIDRDDCIWLAIMGEGLVKYAFKKENAEVEFVDSEDLSDCSGTITEDSFGRLWLSSNGGLVCFDKKNGRVQKFKIDGPLFVTGTDSPVYIDPLTGKYYVGFFKKIISFNPHSIRNNRKPLPIFLTGINILNKEVPVPENRKIHLKPKENNLTISFSGVNLSNGKDNRYSYRISGDNWVDLGSEKQVRFARLTSGNYKLEIRGARMGEDWSALTENLWITVLPPFSKTIWFYLIILVMISFLIYAWYRHRLNQFLKLQKVRTEISGDLHDELGSRLTSLSFLSIIAQRKNPGDKEMRDLLDKIYRNSLKASSSLREIVWGINPELDMLNRLIPYLRNYAAEALELKDIEFINFTDEIPDNFKLKQIARRDLEMIFKEIINNILKHSKAEKVTMTVSHQKKMLNIKIHDDGIGFKMENSRQGNGIKNMKARASNHSWPLRISGEAEKGTTIELEIRSS